MQNPFMKTIFIILSLVFISPLFGQPGFLDKTFGNNGRLISSANNTSSDMIRAIAIQSDNKIVATDDFVTNTGERKMLIIRYNMDGTIDQTFSGNGKIIPSISGNFSSDVKIQTDGKILVAGSSLQTPTSYDIILLRYNVDGSIDDSFGKNGKVLIDLEAIEDESPKIAMQTDGKIVIAWQSGANDNAKFALARLNPNGTSDTTFGGDGGKTGVVIGSQTHGITAIGIVNGNGKIIVVGAALGKSGTTDFITIKFNKFGKLLDYTFADFGNTNDVATCLAIQPDRKILVGGSINGTPPFGQDYNKIGLVRYNISGDIDSSFGQNGRVITVIDSTFVNDGCSALLLQRDGKFIVGGSSSLKFALVRYRNNGTIDKSFGKRGITLTQVGNQDASIVCLAWQGNNIIAGGICYRFNYDFAICRYNGDSLSSNIIQNTNNLFYLDTSKMIYPNPVTTTLNITGIHSSTSYTIIDNQNRIVQKGILNSNTIDVRRLLPNVYYLIIKQNNIVSNYKFLKQ